MKKTALTLTLISAVLFSIVEVQFVSLVEGNFYPWHVGYPDADSPNIAILSPKNNTTYSSGDLNITVHITRSEIPSGYTFESWSVRLLLDGILIDSVSDYVPRSKVDINTVLHSPFNGKHRLEVEASYGLKSLASLFSIKSTSTIYFTVDYALLSPSPSPSPLSTSTPEPTPISSSHSEFQLTGQEVLLGVAITVAVVLVGLGLLVYLIKRK